MDNEARTTDKGPQARSVNAERSKVEAEVKVSRVLAER